MVDVNRLIGVNKVSGEVGNKNLVIRFAGYDATNIEKVSYDIDNGEFNLTVVPKSGFTAPQRENLNFTYSGVSADLIILAGGATDSDFPVLESQELTNAKVVHIGARVLNSAGEIMSFAKPGATVSEIVAELIKGNSLALDADCATNLVMGIEEGSDDFRSVEVTPETFETFAWLLRNGGQRLPKTNLEARDFPPGAIPTQPFGNLRPHKVPMPITLPEETDAQDFEGTQEAEQDINPPDDWLQPKVFKGSAPGGNPDSFSENKG